MKIVKMSLAAAVLVGASAFAVDNVKISGDANVFYSTKDADRGAATVGGLVNGTNGTLFDKGSSAADASLNLNVSADLAKNDLVTVSAGAGYTVISTLGLENNFVGNVFGNSHSVTADTGASYGGVAGGAKVENANWFNEAWAAVSLGNSTLKVGRMELDTPLAFTEKWSIEKNTFEAAVLINTDIPDTTLVGAYVGNGNGTEGFGQTIENNITSTTLGASVSASDLVIGGVVNKGGQFTTYGTDGAYAAGIINNSFKPLTAQAWYYDVSKVAQAYWLQADLSMEGVMAGAQYSALKVDATGTKEDNVYALMLGYEMKDMFTAKVSYSSVNDNGSLAHAGMNTATATGMSKLYTEAWWNYGYVIRSGTDAYNITVEVPVKDIADFGVYYTSTSQSDTGATNVAGAAATGIDMTELTLTASRSFGPLDASLVYSNIKADDQNIAVGATKGSSYNQVQAYLTLNF